MLGASGFLAICLLLGQAETSSAPTSPLAAQVAELVKQLDAPERARREAAEQALLKLGGDALILLPPKSARMSAETTMRLDRVRTALQKNAATHSVRASKVTLKGKGLKLRDVIVEIEKQTGNKLVDFRSEFGEPGPDRPIDLDLNGVPFWQAIDEILDVSGLRIYPHAGADGLALVFTGAGDARPRHSTDIDAFRMEALSFDAHRDLNGDSGNLALNLQLSWEPRLAPIVLVEHLDTIQATDDHGRDVPLAQAASTVELPLNKNVKWIRLPLHFALPERDAKTIKSLRGKLSAILPGGIEEFRFDDLTAKKVDKKSAGATVVLDEVTPNNGLFEARLTIGFEHAGPALESHQTWIFNNDVWVETPKGEKLESVGYQTTHQSPNRIGIAYFFDLPEGSAGHKLVYKTPTAIESMPIDFQLTDLELP